MGKNILFPVDWMNVRVILEGKGRKMCYRQRGWTCHTPDLCEAGSLLGQPIFTTRNVEEYCSGRRKWYQMEICICIKEGGAQGSCRVSIITPILEARKTKIQRVTVTELSTRPGILNPSLSHSILSLLHFHITTESIGYLPILCELIFSHFGWRINHDHSKSQKKK